MKRIVMTLLLVPFMSLATTWYVDGTNGSDENTGTSKDAAKATIQAAIDVSSDNDTILVAPGTYTPIVATNTFVTIRSMTGAFETIIDGCGMTNCVRLGRNVSAKNDVPYATMHGFTIKSCIGWFKSWNHSIVIEGGELVNCVITGCQTEGTIICACKVSNCLIYNNKADWAVLRHGYAQNCAIVSNISNHCTWDNSLKNCIVQHSGEVYISYGNTESYSYNNILDTEIPESQGANNIIAEPHFIDATNGDYRLAEDSPCIDAGDNSYVVGDVDLDGSERIVNGTVDIGCYEFNPDGGPYVEEVDGTNWTYMIKNGKASIGDGVNTAITNMIDGAVDVPTTLRGCPVTAIDDCALYGCSNLTSVTIPASVKTIGNEAFGGCEKLADVYFEGNTIEKIGCHAFCGCDWNLIMHVPTDWHGRGRTLCGYSVWKNGNVDVDKVVTNYVFSTVTNYVYNYDIVTNQTAYYTTVTNVHVHYVKENEKPEYILPSSYDTGFINVVAEVKGGFAVIPSTWTVNYPGFTDKYGTDFSAALSKPNGKYDRYGNPMFVWQDYVAGTNPLDINDVFDATIAIENGEVVVSHTPVLDDDRAALRKYTVYGKKNLLDSEWIEVESGHELEFNFYRVTVEMK